jgi:elongin-A
MAPRSLYEQAKTALIKNISMLNDIGDLPYDFMRSILLRIESPVQLRELEKTCPQVLGLDGEIWLKLIKRDVSGWDKKVDRFTRYEIDENTGNEVEVIGPRKPEDWFRVYKTLKRQADEETAVAEEALFKKMEATRKERAANTIVAPTTMIPPTQAKARSGPSTFSKAADKSVLRFTGGSKTKDLMARVRRETAEHKAQHSGPLGGRATMRTPQRGLNRVQKAPQAFVEARKVENATAAAAREQTTGFRLSKAAGTGKTAISSELAAREARLKNAQASTGPGHSSLAQGMAYKVPKLGMGARDSPSGSPAPAARTGTPVGAKRKREVDIFHNRKKR